MRWLRGVRLSKVNTTLLVFGLALLIVAVVGPRVNVNGITDRPGRLLVAAGGRAGGWRPGRSAGRCWQAGDRCGRCGRAGVSSGRRPRCRPGWCGRPDLSAAVVVALRAGERPVALTGIGGAGKSTLAAGACVDRRVRRRVPGWRDLAGGWSGAGSGGAARPIWPAAWGCRRARPASPRWRRAVTRSPRCCGASGCWSRWTTCGNAARWMPSPGWRPAARWCSPPACPNWLPRSAPPRSRWTS